MANLSKDIQCAGSDTRPPMLDGTDFASWQQRIRLYCRGKENGMNILKSIDEGPFQMGTFMETLADGNEGALHLGPERARVYFDLSPEDKERYNADIRATNILLKGCTITLNTSIRTKEKPFTITMSGLSSTDNLIENLTNTLALLTLSYKIYLSQTNNQLRTSSNTRNQNTVQDGRVVVQNVQGRQNKGQGNNARGTDKMLLMQAQENKVVLDEEQLLFLVGGQDNTIDEDVDKPSVQDLELNVDNVFQANECDAFDYDVDEAPTAHAMFMENLSSVDPVYDAANLSYDLDILSEVHDHDNYQDAICEYHEVHKMHEDVQRNCVVDLDAEYIDVDEPSVQDLALNVDNVFQANECDAFDSDVDEAPTAHAMFLENLSSVDPVYDAANLSYDLDILSEVHDHDNYQDAICEYHEVHKMHEDVQQNCVVDLDAEYTGDSNMISYDQKYDKIEQKNLLITNNNLIPECLSKEVFYIATNSELTVSRFIEMHDAHTVVQARYLELEAELSKLNAKIQ
nr:hypothetical protein [Tanacetum cinerariifolium]